MRWCLLIFLWFAAGTSSASASASDSTNAVTSATTGDDRDDDAQVGRCTGCKDQQHADNLFNVLAHSVRFADRMSYLALDMSWLDRLLDDGAKVHIAFNEFSKVNLETATLLSDELHHQSLSFFHDKSEYKDLKPKVPLCPAWTPFALCHPGASAPLPRPPSITTPRAASWALIAWAAGKTRRTRTPRGQLGGQRRRRMWSRRARKGARRTAVQSRKGRDVGGSSE